MQIERNNPSEIVKDLFKIIDIDFNTTTEAERQVIAAFSFGVIHAHISTRELGPEVGKEMTLNILESVFKYSPEQASDFFDYLVQCTGADDNNTIKAIIHRGIDGHYQYINGLIEELKTNLLSVLAILKD